MTSIRDIQCDCQNTGTAASAGRRNVEFRFFRKDAAQVWIAGDFTGWSNGRLAMQRQADGWWTLNTELAPGEYRFRYVANEQNRETWFTDFAAHGVEFAKGSWNSVLVVPSAPVIIEMPVPVETSTEDLIQDIPQKLAA